MERRCQCASPHTSNIKFHFVLSNSNGDEKNVLQLLSKYREGEWNCPEIIKSIEPCRNFAVIRLEPEGRVATAAEAEAAKLERKGQRGRGRRRKRGGEGGKTDVTVNEVLVYTIFPQKGYVNVSGVRGFDRIPLAVNLFNDAFKSHVKLAETVVDNSTSSGRLLCCTHRTSGKLSLPRFKRFLDTDPRARQQRLCLGLRPFHFPGGILRFRSDCCKKKKLGSVILFSNAKYVIVGAKSTEDIQAIHQSVCALTTACTKTSTLGTWSALTVAS